MRSNDVPEATELTIPFIRARPHGTVTGALQVEILRAVPPCRDKGQAPATNLNEYAGLPCGSSCQGDGAHLQRKP